MKINQNVSPSAFRVDVWLPLALMIAICVAGSLIHYLLFHTIAEMLSIIIAFTAMIVATQSRTFTQNMFVTYLAITIGWCAVLDFIHTLSFKGMNLLETDTANPATQLWIAARLLQALALLISPIFLFRKIRLGYLHLVFGVICTILATLIMTDNFPDMYIENQGLTPLKIYSEYLIIFILCITLVIFWINRAQISENVFIYLFLAVLMAVASEFAFTKYVSVYSNANLLGHILKISSYWFIYLALVDTALTKPFTLLTRASSTFDSIPDATIIVTQEGIILQANHAASKHVQLPVISIIEQRSHQLFHDPEIMESGCPVCSRIAAGGEAFTEIIKFTKQDKVIEFSIAPFLSESSSKASVEVVRDVTQREKSLKEIQDLTYLYGMLSSTSRAIVHCNNSNELLTTIFESMVKGNAFPFMFVAITDNGQLPLRVVHAHGFSIDRLSDLTTSLANPDSPISELIHSLKPGVVESSKLPTVKDHDSWINYLRDQGVTNRAAMPLISGSELLGVVVLYTMDSSIFNIKQIELLQQMSADISFALKNFLTDKLRAKAEESAQISEKRFTEIFHNTPLPLQIVDLRDNKVLMINSTMKNWLGYEKSEIPDENEWLSRVCSTPEEEQLLRQSWFDVVGLNKIDHQPKESPELRLRAKDGSFHIAKAAMTSIENEAIIAWTDLTEIKKKDLALMESEKHFRLMIEQSVAAIYVRRNDKFVYANPRYCEMTGWKNEELIGKDVLDFTTLDPDNIEIIHKAWDTLEHGETNVTYTIPMKHKNGQIIDLELHAKTIDWDGGRAHIILADDITERKRQQTQIKEYVAKLEASMKGTLSAVANMVEMRDPYTAGHERRVGLIARDIALDMGWDQERAKSLELIGLVHDIGKIAIPAEILAKPSKLSPIEMELVRGHVNAGYEILKDIPFPIPVADIIRQHHERIDGSGYPLGLKGPEITPEAKILAVADVVESMATHRPYRPALGITAALEEIIRGIDTKYDGEVANSLNRMIKEKNYQLPG